MTLHSSLPPTTKDQQRRHDLIREHGCICCRIKLSVFTPTEINHVIDGGRISHDHVWGGCPWHHRGVPPDGYDARTAEAMFGPSLKLSKKVFRLNFGDDVYLMHLQAKAIGMPIPPYDRKEKARYKPPSKQVPRIIR